MAAKRRLGCKIICGPKEHWRTCVKLACRNEPLDFGLFLSGSHQLISACDSLLHHQAINRALQAIRELCRHMKVKAYKEENDSGNLRFICINVERSTSLVQVTFVWKGSEVPKDLCQAMLKKKTEIGLHSIWIHFNETWKHGNNIFDYNGRWEHVYGPSAIIEVLDCVPRTKLHFPPNVFRQANVQGFTKIIKSIRSYLDTKKTATKKIVELYGGVGTIGLYVADLCSSLISSDENPYNEKCFNASVRKMKYDKRASYKSLNACDMVKGGGLEGADIVLVDPPRKGLETEVLSAITKSQAELLIYVSCGFQAFCRDQDLLVEAGWTLDKAEGHVLFPGSDHIETLAFFKR